MLQRGGRGLRPGRNVTGASWEFRTECLHGARDAWMRKMNSRCSRPVSDSAACAGMSAYLTIACKISSDWGEVARGRSHSFTMLQTPLSKINE